MILEVYGKYSIYSPIFRCFVVVIVYISVLIRCFTIIIVHIDVTRCPLTIPGLGVRFVFQSVSLKRI